MSVVRKIPEWGAQGGALYGPGSFPAAAFSPHQAAPDPVASPVPMGFFLPVLSLFHLLGPRIAAPGP